MSKPFKYILLLLALTVPAVAGDTGASPETGPLDWPRTMTLDKATFVIYQPQIESWDQYHLEAQSAVAITEAGEENPVYGVLSLEARTRVDKEERQVTFDQLEITKASFPSAPDQAVRYLQLLQERVKDSVRVISLDHFEASLKVVEAVYAKDNTRESIFDAMDRKEVYATTGTRMMVRFFGGWDYTDDDLNSRQPAFRGYEKGVPMGPDLHGLCPARPHRRQPRPDPDRQGLAGQQRRDTRESV